MSILTNIQRIKIIASCLFFIPLVALFFSLFLNNHLLVYDAHDFPISKIKFGKFECNKINDFCNNKSLVNDDGSLSDRALKTKNLLIVVNLYLLGTFTSLLKENV